MIEAALGALFGIAFIVGAIGSKIASCYELVESVGSRSFYQGNLATEFTNVMLVENIIVTYILPHSDRCFSFPYVSKLKSSIVATASASALFRADRHVIAIPSSLLGTNQNKLQSLCLRVPIIGEIGHDMPYSIIAFSCPFEYTDRVQEYERNLRRSKSFISFFQCHPLKQGDINERCGENAQYPGKLGYRVHGESGLETNLYSSANHQEWTDEFRFQCLAAIAVAFLFFAMMSFLRGWIFGTAVGMGMFFLFAHMLARYSG